MASNEENWETQEAGLWLVSNDEESYRYLRNLREEHSLEDAAKMLQEWVEDGNAPQGLYDSFAAPPRSSFTDVDWEEVLRGVAESKEEGNELGPWDEMEEPVDEEKARAEMETALRTRVRQWLGKQREQTNYNAHPDRWTTFNDLDERFEEGFAGEISVSYVVHCATDLKDETLLEEVKQACEEFLTFVQQRQREAERIWGLPRYKTQEQEVDSE